MTRDRLKMDTLAILSALAETSAGMPVPCSTLYLALGCDLARFDRVKQVLVATGHVTATSETMTVTALGQSVGEKINAVMARAKQ